jgi:site-specific DNA-methyltransferase (adenine-specific)
MEYKKHRLNIYPEMSEDEFESLKAGMAEEGFDPDYPIILFEGAIIDGWNRYRAATQLGIERKFKEFNGSRNDAFEYIIKTNKRRSLSSSQKAAIAVEAEDVYAELEAEVEQQRREKISKNNQNQYTKSAMGELITPSQNRDTKQHEESKTRTKLAKKFDTNPRYVSDAKKLREEKPNAFNQILTGKTTIPRVKKQEEIKQTKQAYTESTKTDTPPVITIADCKEYLSTFEDNSIDLLITDPPYMTDVDDIEAFAKSWLPLALQKVKPDGRAYICIGAYPKEVQAYFAILLSQDKFILDNPLIWTYRNTLGQTPKMKYNLNYQMVLHLYSKASAELDTTITKEIFSVQDINAPDGRQGNRLHTWQKPDELAKRLVRHSTKEGDTVVDCFACTGTFLLAAAAMGRKAVGCELSAENAAIAKQRGCDVEG